MKNDYKLFLKIGLIAYIVVYRLIIFSDYLKYSEIINASFLVFYSALAVWLLGYRKYKSSFDSKNIVRSVILYIFLAFVIMYGLGLAVGFLRNAYSRNILTIFKNVFIPIVVIISLEFSRYVIIWANKDKKFYLVLLTMIYIAFDISTSIRTFSMSDAEAIFNLVATIILPVIIKNSVLSYLCYHIGYKVPLLYRLIMDIYIFIIPIIPDIGDYLNSIILIALPSIIYINAFSYIDERKQEVEHIFENEHFSWWDIPAILFIMILAGLVSGFFPIYMVGVGSNSMQPKINKGDAVIIQKVKDYKKLKENDIIAFKNEKNGKVIIHRIKEVTTTNGKLSFVTKGDANNTADTNVVFTSQINGIVKTKIPYIAYPTIWLSESFNKKR